MQLQNKKAIVTGASSGLGAALATALVQKGTSVWGLARNEKRLQDLQQQLGNAFIPVCLDITDATAVTKWVQHTFNDNPAPDILINNAGIGTFGKIDTMPAAEWLNIIQTNLIGMYHITSQLVPYMKAAQQTAQIINIGSIMGTIAKEEATAYCTSKFGVRGFSESLFKELRQHHIKVTCVNPGSIETPFFQHTGIETHAHMLQPAEVAALIIHLLETPDNLLVDEITLRPLIPTKPQ